MAKHSGKSSAGDARHVVLGRRGGRFHDGFPRRGEARGEERREDRGYRNREDARIEREPALSTAADTGAVATVLAQLGRMAQGATAWQLAQELGEESREVGVILRDQVKGLARETGKSACGPKVVAEMMKHAD